MKTLTKLILIAFIVCATRGLAATATPAPKTVYGSWDSISASSVKKGSSISVAGWGADTAATPTATSGVIAKILVDGTPMIEVPMIGPRPDVAEQHGFTDCGFTADIDTSNLTLGEHTIEIRVGGGPSGWNNYTKPVSGKNTFTVTAPNLVSPPRPSLPFGPR